MKCEICRKKITIDESVGYDEFIVCNHCFDIMRNKKLSCDDVLSLIFRCGKIRKDAGYIRIIK